MMKRVVATTWLWKGSFSDEESCSYNVAVEGLIK